MAQMGRPRTFDRQQAIEQALHLFWEQGYETTSLSQLKAQIGGGISAPSFYAAFGSKEALFKEAIECYLATYAQVTACLWDETLAPAVAITQALRRSAKMQCDAGHPKGCMVALGTMSAPSPEHYHQLTHEKNGQPLSVEPEKVTPITAEYSQADALLERLVMLEDLLESDLARKEKHQKPQRQQQWRKEIEQINQQLEI